MIYTGQNWACIETLSKSILCFYSDYMSKTTGLHIRIMILPLLGIAFLCSLIVGSSIYFLKDVFIQNYRNATYKPVKAVVLSTDILLRSLLSHSETDEETSYYLGFEPVVKYQYEVNSREFANTDIFPIKRIFETRKQISGPFVGYRIKATSSIARRFLYLGIVFFWFGIAFSPSLHYFFGTAAPYERIYEKCQTVVKDRNFKAYESLGFDWEVTIPGDEKSSTKPGTKIFPKYNWFFELLVKYEKQIEYERKFPIFVQK